MVLIIYDIEDDEYLYQDISQKQRNYMNIALS
jgi:CRISPR/Cas system-associated endoribonuclease Cas2